MSQGVGTLLRVQPEAKLLNSPSTSVVVYACPPSANIGGMRQPGCPTKNVGNVSWGARPAVSGIDSGLSASAEAIYGVGSGLSASAETTYGTTGLWMTPVSNEFAAEGQAPGSSNDVRVPRRMPAMRPPRMSPEVPGRPHPWPNFPASYEVVNWTALLVDAELPSESILQFVGAHFSEKYKWSRRKHWQGLGCSQSCGCCRSANEEDYASGCTSCNDLWEWKCVSRSTLWRVSIYNGLASRWQWE